jgi:hypothetical protein
MVSVAELSFRTWLVAGLVLGLSRQPLKKLGADTQGLGNAYSDRIKGTKANNLEVNVDWPPVQQSSVAPSDP